MLRDRVKRADGPFRTRTGKPGISSSRTRNDGDGRPGRPSASKGRTTERPSRPVRMDRPRPEVRGVQMAEAVEERSDIIYGRNPVVEALKAHRPINRVYMAQGLKDAASLAVKTLARQEGVVLEEVSRERLDMLTSGNHQGLVAVVAPKEYAELDDILQKAEDSSEAPLLLILDELEDPRNLGAILRTADAAGVDGVIIPQRRAVGLTETVAKASAGAIEHVPVAREINLVRTIDMLKERNIWVAGVDMTGNQACCDADLTVPLALVIGGEDKGIGRLIKEHCDFLINIPMTGKVPSLNASVAASIVLYEVVRQRRAKDKMTKSE